VTGVPLPPSSKRGPGKRVYAALGDSYSSGEGAPTVKLDRHGNPQQLYIANPFGRDIDCHRSVEAYPVRVWQQLGQDWALDFRACSGAKMRHLDEPQHGEPPQKEGLTGASLVTLTMGGNDAGFADVLVSCVLNRTVPGGTPNTCEDLSGRRIEAALFEMQASLPRLYRRIQTITGGRARIIVLGYPRFFPAAPPRSCSTDTAGSSFRRVDMEWMNAATDKANRLIASSARQAGVSFVDVSNLYTADGKRHDLCVDAESQRWINRVIRQDRRWSFHPKAEAHKREAELVLACYRDQATCQPPGLNPLEKTRWSQVIRNEDCIYEQDGFGTQIDGVRYADVTGDGVPDAFVIVTCEASTSSWPEEVQVFDGSSDPRRPTRIGRLMRHDPAHVREITLAFKGHTIRVRGEGLSERAPLCCSDLSVEQAFTWTRGTFKAGDRLVRPRR
jgi:hypothetical protein